MTARDAEYDLLTAAVMGMAVGAGITYLLRRGPSGRRPVAPMLQGAGTGLKWAGRQAWQAGARGADWAGDQGAEMWDRLPRREIRRQVSHARHSIDHAVDAELKSLRRSIRRRRKQLGL